MSKHLWEIDHPYYCNDGNFYNNECTFVHNSWAEYREEFGPDTDMDYNLVFRWDWKVSDYGWGDNEPGDYLHLYHMHQRKGRFVAHVVKVSRDDEDSVREYLTAYAEHMRKIWEPLL